MYLALYIHEVLNNNRISNAHHSQITAKIKLAQIHVFSDIQYFCDQGKHFVLYSNNNYPHGEWQKVILAVCLPYTKLSLSCLWECHLLNLKWHTHMSDCFMFVTASSGHLVLTPNWHFYKLNDIKVWIQNKSFQHFSWRISCVPKKMCVLIFIHMCIIFSLTFCFIKWPDGLCHTIQLRS